MRVTKSLRFGGVRVEPRVDLYNVFNNNAVTSAVTAVGSSLGRPSAIVMGRLLRLGGRVTFDERRAEALASAAVMRRRTFFWSTLSSLVPYVVPRWLYAQGGPFGAAGAATLRDVAGVVLPASLGPERLERAVGQFEQWVREYRAGAEMSAGYGITRLQVVGPDPSADYVRHLQALEAAAKTQGASFARLGPAARATLVTAAIESANVDGLPRRPNGKHIATDLMSHFFFVNDEGQDWLYHAAIERTKCRGLASSAQRPAELA